MKKPDMKKVKEIALYIWKRLTHNIGLKLLSILLAILAWNYVLVNDTTRTRTKTLSGLTGYVSYESTMNDRGLALASDPEPLLNDIVVIVEMPQSEYSYVSQDNVQVTLSLMNVRQAGTQEIQLRATSSYGKVVEVYPSYITCSIEALDSRQIPVNTVLPEEEGAFYETVSVNPGTITVSGAKSQVQSVAAALAMAEDMDVYGTYATSVPYTLVDREGDPVEGRLSCSSSSISVTIARYAERELVIDSTDGTIGQCAPGYAVTGVTVQPESIMAAGSTSLMEALKSLKFEPVSVENASQSFTVSARLISVSGLRYMSEQEVLVTVNVGEETESAWIDDMRFDFINCPAGLSYTYKTGMDSVYVTGPRSAVSQAKENGIELIADLTGLGEGTHKYRLKVNADKLTCEPEYITMEVTLTRNEADNG